MLRRTIVMIAAILLLLVTANVAIATPDAPGTPTLRWVTTSATTAELRADGITDGGQAGNGATAWDIYFRFPETVPAPYPVISVTAGPAFVGLNCGFAASISLGQPSGPGASGDRGVFINGVCTTSFPATAVTGDNVLVATLTFATCPAGVQGFVMDLDSGDDVFGEPVATMVDRNNDAHFFQDSDLTDGSPMCSDPTAVTMSGFDATTDSPAPFAAAAWPLLAGAAAVAAGGAYALLRRKSS
jgi:hypothetical protein